MVDWNDQLRTSLIWLGEAFVVSSIGLTITIYLLARSTEWGRLVRRISWEYFNPSRSTVPLAWLALIVLMTLFSVRLYCERCWPFTCARPFLFVGGFG